MSLSFKREKVNRISKMKKEIEELLQRSEKSKYINEGIRILILGEPNVGNPVFLSTFK
jgi:tRNA U34 5-carboxymethylaminomethyl modifying GTPase MnmE/TrmE